MSLGCSSGWGNGGLGSRHRALKTRCRLMWRSIFLLVSFRACEVSSRADVGGNIDVVCLEPPIEPTNATVRSPRKSTRQQSKVGSTQPLYGRVAGIFFLPRSQLGRCLRQIKQKGGDVRGRKSNREHKSLKTRGSTASCRKERRL
jgi:hypothetical protein